MRLNAYLDLSFIYSGIIISLCVPYYFKRILNYKMSILEIISLMVFYIILYFNVFLFKEEIYLNFLFLFIYFALIHPKNIIKSYLVYLIGYYSSLSYGVIMSSDIYMYHGLVFINKESGLFFIISAFINIVIIEILGSMIKKIKLLENYKMKVKLEIDDYIYDFDGYMDSGNTLIKYDKPVIFLSEQYLKKDDLKEMIVSGVGVKRCKYTEGNITINGTNKNVICAFVEDMSFKGCQCLLNINLLEEKK